MFAHWWERSRGGRNVSALTEIGEELLEQYSEEVEGPESSLAINRDKEENAGTIKGDAAGGAGARSFLIASISSMTEEAILAWEGAWVRSCWRPEKKLQQ